MQIKDIRDIQDLEDVLRMMFYRGWGLSLKTSVFNGDVSFSASFYRNGVDPQTCSVQSVSVVNAITDAANLSLEDR